MALLMGAAFFSGSTKELLGVAAHAGESTSKGKDGSGGGTCIGG